MIYMENKLRSIDLDMFVPDKITQLTLGRQQTPGGIAFDGSFYYVTIPDECTVYKFDKKFTITECITIDKPIGAICYDTKEKVLWAALDKPYITIYKLSKGLKCIGSLEIKTEDKHKYLITGLAYNCMTDSLLATFQDRVVEISKRDGHTCILQKSHIGHYNAVASAAPYYSVISRDSHDYRVQMYAQKNKFLRSYLIPDKFLVIDLIFIPCDALELQILTIDKCIGPVVLHYTITDCKITIEQCNYKLCQKDKEKPCKYACCKILESVAQIETAIASILNIEAEKLQKAVEIAGCVGELIDINKSITHTVDAAAHLEFMLVNKLRAIDNICKDTGRGHSNASEIKRLE